MRKQDASIDSRGRQLLEASLSAHEKSAYWCDQQCEFKIGYTRKLLRLEQKPGRAKALRLAQLRVGEEVIGPPAESWDEAPRVVAPPAPDDGLMPPASGAVDAFDGHITNAATGIILKAQVEKRAAASRG